MKKQNTYLCVTKLELGIQAKLESFVVVVCEKKEEVAAQPGWQIMGCLQSCPRSTCVHVPDQHKASDHDDISVAS